MRQATFTTTLTTAELEASFPLYLKALRLLILEGKTIQQIQRSVCWMRLSSLHQALPQRYKDPNHLYFHLRQKLSG